MLPRIGLKLMSASLFYSGLGSHLHKIDWGHQQLQKFEKNFYVEDKRVTSRSDEEVRDFRRAKEIIVRPTIRYFRRPTLTLSRTRLLGEMFPSRF